MANRTHKPPAVLTYFAQNPDQKHLSYLQEEYDYIYKAWRQADIDGNNNIVVTYLPYNGQMASLQRITDDIAEYKERIVLLHFSGHAGNGQIFLNDGAGNVEGIADLLAIHAKENLKLVFLNGCSTKDQVEVLFRNQIPVVIATQCKVGDQIAKEFAKEFYKLLTKYPCTIEKAYAHALGVVKANDTLKPLLPQTAIDQITQIYETDRGGLETTIPATDIWKLYVRKGAERVIDDPDWWRLPGNDEKPKGTISLEKAYTCDRVANMQVFQAFFEKHGRTKSVHHYLVVDEPELSPQGLSFKLVYEHITRQKLLNRFSYQCDPNETSYEDGCVVLSRYDDVARIANRIYVSLLDEFTKKREWDRFEDFYKPNVVKNQDYVIVFIQIDEAELSGVAGAVREFMTQSTAYAATHPPAQSEKRAKLLFFWHVVVDTAPETSGLTGWWRGLFGGAKTPDKRQVCVEQFGSLYNTKDPAASTLWVVNENVKPLPIPQEKDIKQWLSKNDFSYDPDLTDLADFDNDVRVLENKFRTLIQDKKTREAASRS